MLGHAVEEVEFDGASVVCMETGEKVSLKDLANASLCANDEALEVTAAHYSPTSPPPFMVGMAEVEVDLETGKAVPVDYVAVVDCGTVINPSLARVQTEGGIAQGIGMALYEDVVYSDKGKDLSNSFMQYRVPTRLDVGEIRVDFESSYEPSGPFGAKSIGEIVINTPSPAIASAISHAVGGHYRELPITPEKVYRQMAKEQ